jgi:hypothetical protein
MCWDTDTLEAKQHKNYVSDMPMDEIDEDWALQGCTYGWMMGYKFGEPFHMAIDLLCIRSHSVRVARYFGVITPEFQKNVALRYFIAYNTVKSDAILEKVGSTRLMCELISNTERWYKWE